VLRPEGRLRSLATMSIHDYDADATELLETYGMFCWTPSVSSSPDIDFLMKYIIIGAAFNVTVLVHEFKALF